MIIFNSKPLSLEIGKQLFSILARVGYIDLLANISPLGYPHSAVRHVLTDLNQPLQDVCKLFLLGDNVPVDNFEPEMSDVLNVLCKASLCSKSGSSYVLNGLSLYLVNGLLYFAEKPAPLTTLYYGRDSWAMASRIQLHPKLAGEVLDFCSGPGIQSLISAQNGSKVTSIEINPIAASLEKCNVTLNGYSEAITIRCRPVKDAFTPEDRGQFDRIIANPPLIPIPQGVDYPLPGDGGNDGLKIVQEILEAGLPRLSDNGSLSTIGMCTGDESGPAVTDLLQVYKYDYDIQLCILNNHTLSQDSEWILAIAQTIMLHTGKRISDVCGQLYEKFQTAGSSALFMYAVTLRPKLTTSQHSSTDIADFSNSQFSANDWWIE